MLKMKLNRTALIALTVVLMLSVFSMSAFAEDVILTAPNPNAAETAEDVLDVAPAPTDAEASEETVVNDAETVEETEAAGDTGTTGADEETKTDDESAENDTEEKKGLTTGDIISLAILAVVVIVAVVLCIKNRERLGKYFRSLKGEYKKIVWSPWTQVRKNTLVVIVVVIAVAIVIGVSDYLFSNGIRSLGNLF